MAKTRFKNVLVTGLAMTTALSSVPVMAAPHTGKVTDWEQYKKDGYVENSSNTVVNKGSVYETGHMRVVVPKGYIKTDDPNREKCVVSGDPQENQISRYTDKDGNPFTGLYLETSSNGSHWRWKVLDSDGYYHRDIHKPQYAWDDGNLCADFLAQSGTNLNADDNLYYLGEDVQKEGSTITYLRKDQWLRCGPKWYRSNDKGVCYRNQWFKDTNNGKWYYFNNDCEMVSNRLVDGYCIGADGTCQ